MQQVVVTESFSLITSDTLTFTCITQSSSTLFKPQSVDPSLHTHIYIQYTQLIFVQTQRKALSVSKSTKYFGLNHIDM